MGLGQKPHAQTVWNYTYVKQIIRNRYAQSKYVAHSPANSSACYWRTAGIDMRKLQRSPETLSSTLSTPIKPGQHDVNDKTAFNGHFLFSRFSDCVCMCNINAIELFEKYIAKWYLNKNKGTSKMSFAS
jgi:hypothetical protein